MPVPTLIADPAALRATVERLARCERVALDTEGDGMHAYRTRLCTLQLCDAPPDRPADTVYIVDTLAITDLSPLGPLFAGRAPRLVLHDVSFDARLLAAADIPLGEVIDTSVHARFLGAKATGLGSLLAERHGLSLAKAHQHDDWGRRPITSAQLRYLAEDVAYLGMLAHGLIDAVDAAGIAYEVRTETAWALQRARLSEDDEREGWEKLKHGGAMSALSRAVLAAMWHVREKTAEGWNVPPGRVVSNRGLIALAKALPTSTTEVRRVGSMEPRAVAVVGPLFDAIERVRGGELPPEPKRVRISRQVRDRITAREKALMAWRASESVRRGVDPQVVLPGHVLADVVGLRRVSRDALANIAGMGELRVVRHGDELVALLANADGEVAAGVPQWTPDEDAGATE